LLDRHCSSPRHASCAHVRALPRTPPRRHARRQRFDRYAEPRLRFVSALSAAPLLSGNFVCLKNVARRSPEFLGPRLGDKLFFSFLTGTLYLGTGDDFSPANIINLVAVLFQWTILPACATAAREHVRLSPRQADGA
jgi:hypothetical protein